MISLDTVVARMMELETKYYELQAKYQELIHEYEKLKEKREWEGLTDEDKQNFAAAQHGWEDLLTSAEAALKEKNT